MSESLPVVDDRLEKVAKRIESGDMSLDTLGDLLAALSPPQESGVALSQPATPLTLTEDQERALARVADVFGKVQPTERRLLQPPEVAALSEERLVLDTVASMATERIEAIKATVHVHLDVEAEAGDQAKDALRHQEKGFLILPGEVPAPETGRRWSREVSTRAPSLDATALRKLAEDGEIKHDDYLEMTEQVRVVNEHKVALTLKRKPHLVAAIAKALKPGGKTASIQHRKIKGRK